jgi:hypothetical protein
VERAALLTLCRPRTCGAVCERDPISGSRTVSIRAAGRRNLLQAKGLEGCERGQGGCPPPPRSQAYRQAIRAQDVGRSVGFFNIGLVSILVRGKAHSREDSLLLSSPVASAPGKWEAGERVPSPFQGASSHGFSPWSSGPGHQWLKPGHRGSPLKRAGAAWVGSPARR